MTLTYPALASARQIVWLVTGPDKVEALARLLAGDSSIPAGRVENDRDDGRRRRSRGTSSIEIVSELAYELVANSLT